MTSTQNGQSKRAKSCLRVSRSTLYSTIYIAVTLNVWIGQSALAFQPLSTRTSHNHVTQQLATSKSPTKEEEEENQQPPLQNQRRQSPQWITCSNSKELAHAIKVMVQPGDRVAELGSQLREVSTTICETIGDAGHAVLVDTLRKFPKGEQGSSDRTKAMRRAGDETDFFFHCSSFREIDRLDDWRQAFFPDHTSTQQAYDVFILDVNSIVGNDLEWTTLSLIREFLAMNHGDSCRLVLVKSMSLNQWASRLIHGQRWCQQGGYPALNNQPDRWQKNAAPCYVVATVGVPEYRDAIPYTVRAGDACLEIGCHLGTSTALIQEAAAGDGGYCIGIDIGTKIIQGAQKRNPHIYFEVGDAWRTAALLRTQQTFHRQQQDGQDLNPRTGFDVVYVDVGGLSGQDGIIESLSLISALSNAFEPRAIVIKSLCMRRLSSLLNPYWKRQKRDQ